MQSIGTSSGFASLRERVHHRAGATFKDGYGSLTAVWFP